jgi:hypothetical protein
MYSSNSVDSCNAVIKNDTWIAQMAQKGMGSAK